MYLYPKQDVSKIRDDALWMCLILLSLYIGVGGFRILGGGGGQV